MSIQMNKMTNRQLMAKFFDNSSKRSGDIGAHKTPESSTSNEASTSPDHMFAIIRNIPSQMHSKHLRSYFSDYVENGKFSCFHFRHRPEIQAESTVEPSTSAGKSSPTRCCIVKFCSLEVRAQFIKDYHGRHWMNSEGCEIPRRCFITSMKIAKNPVPGVECMTENDVTEMIELRPPAVMPRGNVGTPSEYFLEQIRLCRLPASLISKLGLKVGRRRRVFDSLPFEYPKDPWVGDGRADFEDEFTESEVPSTSNMPDDSVRREREELAQQTEQSDIREEADPLDPTEMAIKRDFGKDNDDAEANDDDDQCEDWERHEALHEDVTEQDRTKEKKYEEEMEVVWEKGGPGLVWHTDKNYWDEREKGTDCDWAWADDWDVDYSVYYEGKSAGTKDARDAVEIQEDQQMRTGKLSQSVFTRKERRAIERKRRHSGSDAVDVEKYSKGIGSKLLKNMGWSTGTGLGRANQGRVLPVAIQLEEDGQSGRQKLGLGYRGEKMQRTGFEKVPIRHAIASRFDNATDASKSEMKRVREGDDSSEILFRRGPPTTMKYRQ